MQHASSTTLPAMPSTAIVPVIDVRRLAPRERHPRVFSTFVGLAADAAMVLVNDIDPDPLHRSFQVALPGKFAWEVLESGPEVWRVRITRRSGDTVPRDDGRGGSCSVA